ncbi:MAG TPA: NADH-quinone oxidoreductase subunit L [Terriglobia bacterium]|nr:NADH-quinone oxidoreductase subunit L [Terriglobia bacterium]
MSFLDLIWLIPLFPAAGFVINGLFGKRMRKSVVGTIACLAVLVSFVFALGAVTELARLPEHERSHTVNVYQWINAGAAEAGAEGHAEFNVQWGFLLDPLSSVMVLVVTGIGFLIHVYSTGYMAEEDGFYRFFAYLNLFMFSMLTLILGSNYLMMFIGWEGVGLCSYLLIGYYFLKKSAGDAAKKAFVVNRIGDWGLSIGIMLIFVNFGSIEFTQVGEAVRESLAMGRFHIGDMVFVSIALALFVGATGKSAQIPLYVWLPDAMEGPTPVSALIHAATMVTAGVYMVARSNWIFQAAPQAMAVVAVVGALTAIFAASIGIVQNDIKRVLAYSTVSQLGYMFLALGVGAFTAGVFHLMTHAFFKALLFLGSGSVIHALHHEQDMRRMGALKNKIPITFWTMFIGTLAIAGIPGLAGFFSKDEILWRAFSSPHGHILLWAVGALAAGMTAFYMFRLIFLTFFGESRVDHHTEHHIHESPKAMTIPLMVLAAGSIVAGWIGLPKWLLEMGGGEGPSFFDRWLEPVFEPLPGLAEAAAEHHGVGLEVGMAAVSVAIALIGIYLAYSTYYRKSDRADRVAASVGGLYQALLNKWYIDELYDALFVNRAKDFGRFLWRFDARIVDGAVNGTAVGTKDGARGSSWWDRWIVDGLVRAVAGLIKVASVPVSFIQTGYTQNYALIMILGVLALVGYVLWGHP